MPGWPVCAPGDDAAEVTAAQVRQVVAGLVDAGQWRPGDPDILVVADAGYDAPRQAFCAAPGQNPPAPAGSPQRASAADFGTCAQKPGAWPGHQNPPGPAQDGHQDAPTPAQPPATTYTPSSPGELRKARQAHPAHAA